MTYEEKLDAIQEFCGDPDILCQCCGFPTVKEVVMHETAESIIISTPTNSAVKNWCEFKEETE
jgi:hypothetical protein